MGIAPIKPADLRGILKYVPRFKDQIFVVALDGSIVADENLTNILVDIAVLRSLSINIVLVHGIGRQIQELAQARSITISDAHGAGITDAPTLDLAIRASSRVSHQILEGLTQTGLKCAITNAVRAVPVGVVKGVDHGHSGRVDRIDKEFIQHLLSAQILPILQPIGFDRDGRTLRINSDLLAQEAATALNATKILYLAPYPGLDVKGELQRDIGVKALKELLATEPEAIPEASRSKATHAVRSIEAGVPRVHILDGRSIDGVLNEVFSNEGVGTLVYGNDYQQIRKARRSDVRMIYNLTRHAVKREELIYRTQQAIEKNFEHFYVFEIDENLIACVSLHFFDERPDTAEIGSLYVMPFFQKRGVGKKMVEFACLEARRRGATQVVALSTQSYGFFTGVNDFQETEKNVLPEARLKAYEQSGRNPKVLVRKLDDLPTG